MRRRLVFVARHGETDWNAAGRWQGHTDVPLNENGRAQARALAERLRGARLGGVVASDLSRAHETARIVATELGLTVAYVERELRERGFGVFEGLTRAECEARHGDAWQAWLAHRRPPEGAEGLEGLTGRMVAAVGRAAETLARDEAPALVVMHGGALRAVVASVTGELPAQVENGAVWVLVWEGRLVGAAPFEPPEA
ncbi:MAG TPA: histidine phosphatase family protein [Polyangiaceae bacterium]|jgi:probable phosphoglycerate mutase|nr:histidine phosphatase family protein [Polyangiaceae bacterium]